MPTAPKKRTRQDRETGKVKARNMYVAERKPVEAIAAALGVDRATIFRWKAAGDWDNLVKAQAESGIAMQSSLMESLQKLLQEFANDPQNSKVADSIAKVFKVAKQMDRDVDRLGSIVTFAEKFVSFCGEYYPDVVKLLAEPMEAFLAKMGEENAR